MNTGAALAGLRRARALSRERAAELSGMHPNSLAELERGQADASCRMPTALCPVLGCAAVLVEPEGFGFIPDSEPGYPASRPVAGRVAPAIASATGESVAALRRSLGLSLRELASISGVHRNTIWNLERGLVSIGMVSFHRICRALGVIRLDLDPGTGGLVLVRSQDASQ